MPIAKHLPQAPFQQICSAHPLMSTTCTADVGAVPLHAPLGQDGHRLCTEQEVQALPSELAPRLCAAVRTVSRASD